jgi:predicted transcriptional regulator
VKNEDFLYMTSCTSLAARYRLALSIQSFEEFKMPTTTEELLTFVSEVVAAQISKKKMASSEIPPLIRGVYQAFQEISVAGTPAAKPVPAVPIGESVTPDYIVCLEDGRQLKLLKRYIRTV